MLLSIRGARILDFDIENRPLSYYGSDLTTGEVTAIAAGFADRERIECFLLDGRADHAQSMHAMLVGFRVMYEAADIVTGHYIRKHDLPLINGAMVEFGLPPLEPKLTIDTKLDLIKWSFEAQPKSQEELALTLGIAADKVKMTQHDWREANRLTERGMQLTYERVIGDVRQHKQLRLALHRRGLLGPAKVWRP